MTLENVEAQLRDDQTIYARLAGYQQVDLFNVSAGVRLKVTPHLIPGAGESGPHPDDRSR